MNFELTRFQFTMPTRIAVPKTFTLVIQRRRATHTLVQTAHVAAIIHRDFTVQPLPIRRTGTAESAIPYCITTAYGSTERYRMDEDCAEGSRTWKMLTLIQARVRPAWPTVVLTLITIEVHRAEAPIAIRADIVAAGATVLTWLENVAGCTRYVALYSDAGAVRTGRYHERRSDLWC